MQDLLHYNLKILPYSLTILLLLINNMLY